MNYTNFEDWVLDRSPEIENLKLEVQHYQAGFAAIYMSTHHRPVNLETVNSFVGFCLEKERAGSLESWNSRPQQLQEMSSDEARAFLTTKYADTEVEDPDEEGGYRKISDKHRQEVVQSFFDLFHASTQEVKFYSNCRWIANEGLFKFDFNLGPVLQSKGIVGITKSRIGLFYFSGYEYWKNPTIISL